MPWSYAEMNGLGPDDVRELEEMKAREFEDADSRVRKFIDLAWATLEAEGSPAQVTIDQSVATDLLRMWQQSR